MLNAKSLLISYWKLVSLIMLLMLLQACSSTVVKTTEITPIVQETQELHDDRLLDVGILTFDLGLEQEDQDEDTLIFAEVRAAEARYFPHQLMSALQLSAAWGAVRVVPSAEGIVDVLVKGKILHSDGESMKVAISVSDATGRKWFDKDYEQVVSKYSYENKRKQAIEREPFQNIYHLIANDLLNYKRKLDQAQTQNIRAVAELSFAQSFAPEVFSPYLKTNESGLLDIARLPSDQDPMVARIRQIRERDYLFIDTLQEYYGTFAKEMQQPYQQWRRESYNEVLALRSVKRSARNSKIVGLASVLAGIMAVGNSGSGVGRATGSVGIAAGGYIARAGFEKDAEAQIHIEALQELGDSLEASIAPQVIELEDRTITLTGTVDNQYNQWREILHSIYKLDNEI